MAERSICQDCFHSYVCEQYNENKDDNNEKCHFFNNHFVPTADVAPRNEVAREIFEEIGKLTCTNEEDWREFERLKKKYTEKGGNNNA